MLNTTYLSLRREACRSYHIDRFGVFPNFFLVQSNQNIKRTLRRDCVAVFKHFEHEILKFSVDFVVLFCLIHVLDVLHYVGSEQCAELLVVTSVMYVFMYVCMYVCE
jgi:hypothetical protein